MSVLHSRATITASAKTECMCAVERGLGLGWVGFRFGVLTLLFALCCVVLCCAVLFVVLCCVVLCCVVLYCAVLCCVVLCCGV